MRISSCILYGADLSVVPPNPNLSEHRTKTNLFAANGSIIKTYGLTILTPGLGLGRPLAWTLMIAKVSKRIIGADFLNEFGLIIDKIQNLLINVRNRLSQARSEKHGLLILEQCKKQRNIISFAGSILSCCVRKLLPWKQNTPEPPPPTDQRTSC